MGHDVFEPRTAVREERRQANEALGRSFSERQIGRLGVVGSNPTTAPVIEESYRRLLHALDATLTPAGGRLLRRCMLRARLLRARLLRAELL